MKRRQLVRLSQAEQLDFLRREKTIILSTIDRIGYPHSVAMWYVVDADGCVLMTTYSKSQKAVNIRRNPKVSLLVESGGRYDLLKGILIRGDAEIIDDLDTRLAVVARVHQKMVGAFPPGVEEALQHQASKRAVIKVVPKRTSCWDHSKLGGRY